MLKDIVEEDSEEKLKDKFLKFKTLYDDTKDFIIKNKLILYGGTALNELLPSSKKFYEQYTLPDYDCFSLNAKQHAINLADYLFKKKYQFIEVKSGIHEGTYKVFAEFNPIADITQVTEDFYHYMLTKAKNNITKYQSDPKYIVVPPVFLKWSLHLELSRPKGSIHRWEKLFKRYLTFTSEYNIKSPMKLDKIKSTKPEFVKYFTEFKIEAEYDRCVEKNQSVPETAILAELIESFQTFVKSRNYVLVGNFATGLHIGLNKTFMDCCRADNYTSAFEILCINVEDTLKNIQNQFKLPKGYKYTIMRSTKKENFLHLGEILPPRAVVYISFNNKDYRLFTLLETAHNCYSVCDLNGYRVGTVDTLLTFFYGFYMVYDYYFKLKRFKKQHLDIYQTYINILEEYSNKIKDRFSTSCFGEEKTLTVVRRENWIIRPFMYRPTINKYKVK
jgi:hypothetical protein